MKTSCSVLFLSLGLVALAAPVYSAAPQWESLFDGSNLNAFEIYIKGGQAPKPCFEVAQGVIRTYPGWAEGAQTPNGMIRSKKAFGSYHLRWQYRYDGRKFRDRRNSGVLYHVQGTEVWPVCMEFQLMENNGGWPVFMYAQAKMKMKGDRYDASGEAREVGDKSEILVKQGASNADKPIGKWNQGELLVQGNRAYHVVNGQVIARLENLKQANASQTRWIPLDKGRIAFQCEGAGIEFRNIEIMENPVGYIDTPVIPGQPWRVHDNARPQPSKAVLGPCDQRPAPAPADAVILLGPDTYKFTNKDWRFENGVMTVDRVGKRRFPQKSTVAFGDGHYHVEWTAPTEIKGTGQGRGNSGVYLMGTYEIQVLDNWNNYTYADGMVGSVYGQMPPLANAVRKPGEWNYYDIFFKAPAFAGDTLVKPAYVTVMLNGVIVQNNQEILGAGTHRNNTRYKAHPPKLPLSLQDHNNPTQFRNIWVRPLDRDVTKQ